MRGRTELGEKKKKNPPESIREMGKGGREKKKLPG